MKWENNDNKQRVEMIEKFNKNKNEWYLYSFGMILLAIVIVLNGHTEISFVLLGISVVLMGIGTLYNQHSVLIKQGEELISLRKKYIEEIEQIKAERGI